MKPFVVAVSRSPEHTSSKPNEKSIKLIKGNVLKLMHMRGKSITTSLTITSPGFQLFPME